MEFDFEYNVIKKRGSKSTIRIEDDGGVTVTVPADWTRQMTEDFIYKHRRWINNHRTHVLEKTEVELSDEDIRKLKALAQEVLTKKTDYYAKLMGVEYLYVKITSAKGRFGSCGKNKRICYSYRLMLYPEKAIDYVVVHELSHIKHFDHSKDFYRCIEKYLPDYKEREKLLKGRQTLPF